jgi:hypothetical protein
MPRSSATRSTASSLIDCVTLTISPSPINVFTMSAGERSAFSANSLTVIPRCTLTDVGPAVSGSSVAGSGAAATGAGASATGAGASATGSGSWTGGFGLAGAGLAAGFGALGLETAGLVAVGALAAAVDFFAGVFLAVVFDFLSGLRSERTRAARSSSIVDE